MLFKTFYLGLALCSLALVCVLVWRERNHIPAPIPREPSIRQLVAESDRISVVRVISSGRRLNWIPRTWYLKNRLETCEFDANFVLDLKGGNDVGQGKFRWYSTSPECDHPVSSRSGSDLFLVFLVRRPDGYSVTRDVGPAVNALSSITDPHRAVSSSGGTIRNWRWAIYCLRPMPGAHAELGTRRKRSDQPIVGRDRQ